MKNTKVLVKRVYLNKVPTVHLYPEHKKDSVLDLFEGQTKLYLQIFKDQNLVFSSTDNLKEFPITKAGEELCFEVNKVFEGDVLFRIRHFLTAEIRYPVTRFMLNSGFMNENETIVQKYNLDFGKCIEAAPDFFIKVQTEPTTEHSDYSDLLMKTRLKEKFLKNSPTFAPLKLKKNDLAPSGGSILGKLSGVNDPHSNPKSPAFVILDSPLKVESSGVSTSSQDKTPTPKDAQKAQNKPKGQGEPIAPKSIEKKLSTGGVFFKDSTPLDGTPGSKNTLGSQDNEEEPEEDEEVEAEEQDMETYLKSLEKKAEQS